MTDLATPADVVARLGRAFTAMEDVRVGPLLTDASAAVRAYTGQTLTLVEDDVARLRQQRRFLTLPQRPVTDVTSVVDADGTEVGFSWYEGDDQVYIGGVSAIRIDLDFPMPDWRPLTVTYSHGYDPVPDDIIAVVCGVTLRALGRTPLESGVQQQSIAGYSETIGPVGAAGPVGFLNEEKAILDRYKRAARVLAGGW